MKKICLVLGLCLFMANVANATMYDVNDNDDGSSTNQSGWIDTSESNINGVTFTAVGAGVVLADRSRTYNGGGTESDMWEDFIFANPSDSIGEGMDVTVTGLLINTTYDVSVWAYDEGSNRSRSALWTGSNGGTSAILTFNGGVATTTDGVDPTSLSDYTASFTAVTDGGGTLTLEGRFSANSSATDSTVFLNGFELTAVPEPSSLLLLGIASLGLVGVRRRRKA